MTVVHVIRQTPPCVSVCGWGLCVKRTCPHTGLLEIQQGIGGEGGDHVTLRHSSSATGFLKIKTAALWMTSRQQAGVSACRIEPQCVTLILSPLYERLLLCLMDPLRGLSVFPGKCTFLYFLKNGKIMFFSKMNFYLPVPIGDAQQFQHITLPQVVQKIQSESFFVASYFNSLPNKRKLQNTVTVIWKPHN